MRASSARSGNRRATMNRQHTPNNVRNSTNGVSGRAGGSGYAANTAAVCAWLPRVSTARSHSGGPSQASSKSIQRGAVGIASTLPACASPVQRLATHRRGGSGAGVQQFAESVGLRAQRYRLRTELVGQRSRGHRWSSASEPARSAGRYWWAGSCCVKGHKVTGNPSARCDPAGGSVDGPITGAPHLADNRASRTSRASQSAASGRVNRVVAGTRANTEPSLTSTFALVDTISGSATGSPNLVPTATAARSAGVTRSSSMR